MRNSLLRSLVLLATSLWVASCDKTTNNDPVPTPTPTPRDTSGSGSPGGTGTTPSLGVVTIAAQNGSSGELWNDSVTVVMSSAKTTDTILYTTTGVDPVLGSTRYTAPIKLKGGATFKARINSGVLLGPVTTKTYTISNKVFRPSFSTPRIDTVNGGPVEIVITASNESEDSVRYTTNGADPSSKSKLIASGGKLTLTQNTMVIARAYNGVNTVSDAETTQVYLKVLPPKPVVDTGMRDSVIKIDFTSATAGATIRYSMTGTPTCSSARLLDPIQVDSSVTVKAIACKDGWVTSDVVSTPYRFKVGRIKFTPDSGIYRYRQAVGFLTRSPGATFFYTTDSSVPTWDTVSLAATGKTKALLPNGRFNVDSSQWVRVVGVRKGWLNSDTALARYVVEGDTLLIEDYEQNKLSNPVGDTSLVYFACGWCSQGGKQNLTVGPADTVAPGWNKAIGYRTMGMNFDFGTQGATQFADGKSGPAYAGVGVRVPSTKMGETYRLVFWAKFVQSSVTKIPNPAVTIEMVRKKNGNFNGGYSDGFGRSIQTIDGTWREFVVDYGAFGPAWNAFEGKQPDSTDDTQKAAATFYYPDSLRMAALGYTKYQGRVTHNNFKPKWKWDVDQDLGFVKDEIIGFRWSIIQPLKSLAQIDSIGSYILQRNYPYEPGYTTVVPVPDLYHSVQGTLYLDKIQLIRWPH